MSDLHGFPYIEFQVDKAGTVIEPAERARAVDLFGQGAVTDLLVLSHGWNNDMAEARTLYDRLLAALRACLVAGTPPLGARRLGVRRSLQQHPWSALLVGGDAGGGAVNGRCLAEADLRITDKTAGFNMKAAVKVSSQHRAIQLANLAIPK